MRELGGEFVQMNAKCVAMVLCWNGTNCSLARPNIGVGIYLVDWHIIDGDQ